MKVIEIRDILTNKLLAYKVDGNVVGKDDKKVKEWIKSGNTPLHSFSEEDRRKYLEKVRKSTLKSMFYSNLADGMFSKILGGKVNCRIEDIENVRFLQDFMDSQKLSKIKFRMFDNSYKIVTKAQIKSLYIELIRYYFNKRYHKWTLDGLIKVSKEPQKIEWSNELKRRFPEETKEVKE